jgi:Ser/Thr protein kinase RdoA (MazF antagonist)
MQEILLSQFEKLGSLTARLHNTGEKKEAQHRNFFGPTHDYKWDVLDQLYQVISPEVRPQYFELAEHVFQTLDEKLKPESFIRIHGDMHRGNLLDNGKDDITVVDFDDFLNGPVIQDFWMIFPDQEFAATKEFELFLKGYESLRHFDDSQLELVPYIRSYRVICYAGWILNRWSDPSFPKIFPEFNTYRYWAEELDSLRKIIKI